MRRGIGSSSRKCGMRNLEARNVHQPHDTDLAATELVLVWASEAVNRILTDSETEGVKAKGRNK